MRSDAVQVQQRQGEPEVQLIALDDGRIKVVLTHDDHELSQASIIPMTMRYGVATVRMDGIGGVATDEAHRNRGYSRRVMEAAVDRMRQGPAAVTSLYGISGFYPKYSYATLGPESIIGFRDLDELGRVPTGWTVHPAKLADLPAIQAIYEERTGEATGALVREADGIAWSRLRESLERNDGECRVVVDSAETLLAYAWRATGSWWMPHWERWVPGGLKLAEAFASSPMAAEALLAGCADWARELQQDGVALAVPPEGHIGLAAMLRTSEMQQRYTHEGEFMGRVVGAEALMRSLQPELSRVWVASGGRFRGSLCIDTEEDNVQLELRDDGVTVSDGMQGDAPRLTPKLSPGELARLVFGGMPPAEQLARMPGVDSEARDVLVALFPRRFPYIYPADRF